MKLLDKIKNAIFEEDEFEELEKQEEVKQEPPKVEEVVKKIDIAKKIEIPREEQPVMKPLRREQHRKTPVIFDEEDFIMEEKRLAPKPKKEPRKMEEPKKPLYGGYKD